MMAPQPELLESGNCCRIVGQGSRQCRNTIKWNEISMEVLALYEARVVLLFSLQKQEIEARNVIQPPPLRLKSPVSGRKFSLRLDAESRFSRTAIFHATN